ncbi:MAG: hypothetical protein O2798_06925 [Chloroflexi bacterium]|nr:hypothetical protein [Chloroflexota bacterium]MDA1240559.1 hypothetical protein [Chloroflexota bacterium]MQC47850.1 hypothetical protein [Chloroflexota bacterium]
MNVILNTHEAHVVLTLVTSVVLDHVELSSTARDKVRDWRREHALETGGLDEFTETLNEAIGNFIDERTQRMMRVRGKVKTRSAR